MIAVCPGGTASRVDRDGDGISDLVEASNRALGREELDPLRCDPDPSRAVGRPYKGKLAKGVNLPDTGTGFKHFLGTDAKDSDDWGTLAMVQCFEAVGQGMNAMGREVGITDLSSIDGGRFVPHKSHQTGIDADVRYLRTDKKNWPLDLKRYPDLYDEAATLAMFKLFAKHCAVDVVFVDTHRIGFSQDDVPELRLAHAGGHSNHFHVRLNLGGE